MILQALFDYYNKLELDPESSISPPGYSVAKVSFALNISVTGELLELFDLRQDTCKKLLSSVMIVPKQIKRTKGVSANFLCDNAMYVLGFGLGKSNKISKVRVIVKTREKFEAFFQRQWEIIKGVDDLGAIAVLNFLKKWDFDTASSNEKIVKYLDDLLNGANLVFKLEGETGYIHERSEVKKAWEKLASKSNAEYETQCLVTGRMSSISRIHQNIKGVYGAISSGASLVSFGSVSFESFRKIQSFNAPVSDEATFKYTTALNYLLSNDRHRIWIGDTTIIFWAEKPSLKEENLMSELLNPFYNNDENARSAGLEDLMQHNSQNIHLLKEILKELWDGRPFTEKLPDIDPEVNFFILGLAPNSGRLSVRHWHIDSFGRIAGKIAQHYADLSIEGLINECVSSWMILKEIAYQMDWRNASPILGGALLRSILTGELYPESLYSTVLSRIRADNKISPVRASVIKACLIRKTRIYNQKDTEEVLTMGLNENSNNTAYRLGRLFALLEKAQHNAVPGLNATIKDRFLGAASASPARVFPQLLRLTQYHIAKAEYGGFIDKKIEEVLSGIEEFPGHLNLEEQGKFVLGYYHQRHTIYKKNEQKEG